MTRMLGWFALIILMGIAPGCSLFSPGGETGATAEVAEEGDADLLDSANALDAELEGLESEEQPSEEFADSGDAGSQASETGGDEDFSASAEGSEESFDDQAFSDEFQDAEIGGDDFADLEKDPDVLAFSGTTESEVDQNLATAELGAEEAPLGSEEVALDGDALDMGDEEDAGEADNFVEASAGNVQVTNLAYKAFENGGTVVIETSSPVTHDVQTDSNLNQIVVELSGVNLPERFKRPYITKDFKQDIATINAYQEPGTSSARVVIQLKRPMDPVVQAEGNSILVMTTQPELSTVAGVEEESLDDLVANNQMEISTSSEQAAASAAVSSPGTVGAAVAASKASMGTGALREMGGDSFTLSEREFSGEKISLEFTDTDVRTIVEVIAEKSGVNLIMDDDVGGKTNLRLRNVPWDQALVVLLRSKSLGYVKQGNVLRIARQETLSKEAQAVSDQIKNEKEAKLLSSGIKVKYIPVSYAKVQELASKLKDFLSKEGKVAFDERTSSLVITDYPEYIERVRELVKALDTPPMQVEIAAKLVEAREVFLREAGINWDTAGAPVNLGGGRTATFNSSLNNGEPGAFTLDLSVGTFDIFGDLNAALSIFEQQDKVKVLSQPRVVTMNKTKAIISQVTQIPIETVLPVMGVGQAPIPNITYQDLTLALDVTPQITFNGDVILDVDLRREFPGGQAANGQVEINKRQARTSIMVKNGKTAVIGGIYQIDEADREAGIPWLKDIPLLGYLFKRVGVERNKNELLLFLKPKILKEVEGDLSQQPEMAKSPTPDAFEELSIDEGSFAEPTDTGTTSDSFGEEEDLNDDFQELDGEAL